MRRLIEARAHFKMILYNDGRLTDDMVEARSTQYTKRMYGDE